MEHGKMAWCYPAGSINTLSHITEKGERIDSIRSSGASIGDQTYEVGITVLKSDNVERLGISHRSGLKMAAQLERNFEEGFFSCNMAKRLTV